MRDTFRLRNAPLSGTVLTLLFTLGIVFLPTDWLGDLLSADPLVSRLAGRSILRLVGFGFLFWLMLDVGYRPFACNRRALLVLPLFLVAVNNLPVIALALGQATVDRTALIPLFALECLSVALFEETAFRGLIFPFMRTAFDGKRKRDLLAIIASSCLFGLIHLVNLASGIGPTLLQVGYSALIGALCALIVHVSGNLFLAVAFHAIYNFCGYLVPQLGSGTLWDIPTVVLTAAVALLVAVYAIVLFYKISTSFEKESDKKISDGGEKTSD